MELKNTQWRHAMAQAGNDVNVLSDPSNIKMLTTIIKINARVCQSAGTIYVHQLSGIFLDLMNLNKYYSKLVNDAVAAEGPIAVKKHQYKVMRELKGAILDLLTTFFEVCREGHDTSALQNPDLRPAVILQTFMPKLMGEILTDYKNSPSCARDSKVLSLFAQSISTFQGHLAAEVPRIMDAVFESTLEVITSNMLDHPEHRTRFFKFLQAANEHCFMGLFSIPQAQQKMVVDSIVWAVKHTDRNISETGLDILQDLLTNVNTKTASAGEVGVQFAQEFYKQFLVPIIQDVLGVMTDRLHKSGFKQQAYILMNMFHLVQGGQVQMPLFDTVQHPNFADNASFLKEHVGQLLLQAFPNLSTTQVIAFVTGCFDPKLDINAFKQHLRDFLINVKEYAAGDRNDDLFDEEKQLQQEKVSDELLAYQKSIPGLLKPSEIED